MPDDVETIAGLLREQAKLIKRLAQAEHALEDAARRLQARDDEISELRNKLSEVLGIQDRLPGDPF
jgi:DNA repair exonuclease SbcCD ATPase subunit